MSQTGNTRHTPWLRRLFDGVGIVASILLAFGIEAWWASRQHLELERQALSTLTEAMPRSPPTTSW